MGTREDNADRTSRYYGAWVDATGIVTLTAVPWPSEWISSRPPRSVTRSRIPQRTYSLSYARLLKALQYRGKVCPGHGLSLNFITSSAVFPAKHEKPDRLLFAFSSFSLPMPPSRFFVQRRLRESPERLDGAAIRLNCSGR